MTELIENLKQALENRTELLSTLAQAQTNCYRLFHGTNEGQAGLTIDRYGSQLFIQSFHESLTPQQLEQIEQTYSAHFDFQESIYNDRSDPHSRRKDADYSANSSECLESGHRFLVKGKHQGQDPLLFLDFRVARKWLQANCSDCSVLNLFAYTCSMGIYAAAGGAKAITHVDFARRNLQMGKINHELNPTQVPVRLIHDDYFVVARQMSGLGIKQHRSRKKTPFQTYAPEQFDRVILDPPRWAKSAFGTVDLIRDYASVLKPAILCTAPGGQLLCTNNVAKVSQAEWLEGVQRCAKKVERPIRDLQILTPETDFPSPDGNYPLKIAILHF